MLFFGACFFLYFIKLSAGKGFYIHVFHANSRDTQPKMNNLFWPDVLMQNCSMLSTILNKLLSLN